MTHAKFKQYCRHTERGHIYTGCSIFTVSDHHLVNMSFSSPQNLPLFTVRTHPEPHNSLCTQGDHTTVDSAVHASKRGTAVSAKRVVSYCRNVMFIISNQVVHIYAFQKGCYHDAWATQTKVPVSCQNSSSLVNYASHMVRSRSPWSTVRRTIFHEWVGACPMLIRT